MIIGVISEIVLVVYSLFNYNSNPMLSLKSVFLAVLVLIVMVAYNLRDVEICEY